MGQRSHRRQRIARVPTVVALQAEGQIGLFERPRQLCLHRAELHGVRARLEHGQHTRQADALAQAGHRGADGGRVVREVVVHRHAAGLADQLHAAFDILELRQRRGRGLGRNADMLGRGDRRQRVQLVVLALQRPFDAADLQAAAQHIEGLRLAACA
jgi:hypothetical protein